MRAFCALRQVHIGPFQREQFAVGAQPGIDRQNRSVPEILGSLRQILCLFRKAQNAVPAFGLRQFVDGGRAVQSAPLHGKMQNPPQRAQIAVHGHNGILRHLLPVPGVPAHCLACNRVQRGICDGGERQQPLQAHAVERVRSRLCVRLGVLQEFLGEGAEDGRGARGGFRPGIVRVNLAKPQRPPMLVLRILSVFPLARLGGLPNAETLHRPVLAF